MPANKSKVNKSGSYYHLFILVIVTLSFVNLVSYKLNLGSTVVYATIEQNVEYWEGVIKKYPSYRDAYVVLASIHRSRGEFSEAEKLITKAREIDPYLPYEEL